MAHHCPVCGQEFPSTTGELRFQRHVNRCLDGEPDIEDPTPLYLHPHGTAQRVTLQPNPDSYVSLAESSLTTSPLTAPRESTPPQQAEEESLLEGVADTQVNDGSAGRLHSTLTNANERHLTHAESSSLDYYAALEENCEFICGLCPDFPRALVEEVLIANGNRKDLAMSTLFELKDQSERAVNASGGRGTFHSYWGGDKEGSHGGHKTSNLHRANLRALDQQHEDQRGVASSTATGVAKGPQYSHVELAIYDLQPDSTVAKKVGLGAYHTGVVLYGHEFSFGGTRNLKRDTGRSGIWATRNLYQTAPIIKKRIVVGITYVTIKELQAQLREWGKTTWRVDDYHLLSKNCNHFADALLQWMATKSVLLPVEVQPLGTPASLAVTSARTPVSPVPLAATAKASGDGTPAGVTPLPKFPSTTSPTTSTSAALPTTPNQLGGASVTFPLPLDQQKRVQEAFKLPPWVNRAAAVGNAVIPDFLFKKIVEALMPPVPEDNERESTPL